MACFEKPVKLDNPRAWRTYLGGSLLSALHDEAGEDGHFPEEWIMSVVAARNAGREEIVGEGLSHLVETGETLKEWIQADAEAILGGEHVKQHGSQPGVLVKLIDSAERLTIQVHPDRQTARTLFGSPVWQDRMLAYPGRTRYEWRSTLCLSGLCSRHHPGEMAYAV